MTFRSKSKTIGCCQGANKYQKHQKIQLQTKGLQKKSYQSSMIEPKSAKNLTELCVLFIWTSLIASAQILFSFVLVRCNFVWLWAGFFGTYLPLSRDNYLFVDKFILTAGSRPAMPAYASACGMTVRPTVIPATISPIASWLEYLLAWKMDCY